MTKCFYRILGAIAGLLLATALVSAFAEHGELFWASVAAWICFCNLDAPATRDFASYWFLPAGHTLTIVGAAAALASPSAYLHLVARAPKSCLASSARGWSASWRLCANFRQNSQISCARWPSARPQAEHHADSVRKA